jgi:hypothetical protein
VLIWEFALVNVRIDEYNRLILKFKPLPKPKAGSVVVASVSLPVWYQIGGCSRPRHDWPLNHYPKSQLGIRRSLLISRINLLFSSHR